MKADPEAQRRLLDLQAIDIALTQLAHRRKALPEHAELDRLARELSTMEDQRVRAQVAVDDLDRDISRLERDAAGVETIVSDLSTDPWTLHVTKEPLA